MRKVLIRLCRCQGCVAINTCTNHWLKVHSLQVCEKVYFDQLFDFLKWLLLFLQSLRMCHIRNTEQLLIDTRFRLKSKSFGSNFFHLAKMLATTNSEPGLAFVVCKQQNQVFSQQFVYVFTANTYPSAEHSHINY